MFEEFNIIRHLPSSVTGIFTGIFFKKTHPKKPLILPLGLNLLRHPVFFALYSFGDPQWVKEKYEKFKELRKELNKGKYAKGWDPPPKKRSVGCICKRKWNI